MKRLLSILPLLHLALLLSAQTGRDTEKLAYIDSTFRFKIAVPKWFKPVDTKIPYAWGGTLPAVDGIENAILVKVSAKDGKMTFRQFEDYVVGKWEIGGHPKWSEAYVCKGIKALPTEFKRLGKSYKVDLMNGDLSYQCQYVLIETSKAFLWVDFIATPSTFAVNKGKFSEFMRGLEVLPRE